VRNHIHAANRSVAATGIATLADMPADRSNAPPCSVEATDGKPVVVTADPPTSKSGIERIGMATKLIGVLMIS
jgi:hypothetical protein